MKLQVFNLEKDYLIKSTTKTVIKNKYQA